MVSISRVAICLGVLVFSCSTLRAECYALYFSHQSRVINWPSTSHTWAVYVETDSRGRIVEVVQINWFAADYKLQFFGPPEKGINRDYMETVLSAKQKGYRVSMWGPLRIDPELYKRAKKREFELVSGLKEYHLLDIFGRADAPNCMHANTDLDDGRHFVRTLFARGERGTFKVARHLERWFIADTVHGIYVRYPEIARQLGLENLGIEQRELSRQ
jgi:hypothetical protein